MSLTAIQFAPTIPDFLGFDVQSYGVDWLAIPVKQNDLIGQDDYNQYAIKIKSVSSDKIIGSYRNDIGQEGEEGDFRDRNCPKINLNNDRLKGKLVVGEYYKIQIAYANELGDEYTIGPYSNAGIFKRTAPPNTQITQDQDNPLKFTGVYTAPTKDPSEKEYYYSFQLKSNDNDEIVATSGKLIHNQDVQQDTYEFTGVPENREYFCVYTATTNNLVVSTVKSSVFTYNIPKTKAETNKLIVNYNYDDGYANIKINDVNSKGLWKKKDNGNWEQINAVTESQEYRDFDYEQGSQYSFAYMDSNNKLCCYPDINTQLFVDYEDMFLFDKNRQLAIRYNPQISSISRITQESKTETIGSKYPFFFHNTDIDYKEFQISGLIAISIDENELFSDKYIIKDNSIRTTTYAKEVIEPWNEGKSIANERRFKLEVLEWLGNGEPKVLKTPYEGNYIVHLSSVSLSPEGGLGRKLHNFQCTADEICEYNTTNLKELDLI